MQKLTASTAVAVVPAAGGEVYLINDQGELVMTCGLEPGLRSLAAISEVMAPDDTLEASDGVSLVAARVNADRARRISYGRGSHSSGANPDFRPQTMTPGEAEIRRSLLALGRRNDSLAKKLERFEAEKARPNPQQSDASTSGDDGVQSPDNADQGEAEREALVENEGETNVE